MIPPDKNKNVLASVYRSGLYRSRLYRAVRTAVTAAKNVNTRKYREGATLHSGLLFLVPNSAYESVFHVQKMTVVI